MKKHNSFYQLSSVVKFHFVFCPRYRRKIFLISNLENVFRASVLEICQKNNFQLLHLSCFVDHVCLSIRADPTFSAADIMRIIKFGTSKVLLKQFSDTLRTPTLWTRDYFVSTEELTQDIVYAYVHSQKTRGS